MAEGSTPGLPPALRPDQLPALRAAFSDEVSARVGPLHEAAALLAESGDLEAARVVSRHAHVFATSAVILGEELASYQARRCEVLLEPFLAGSQPVPDDVATQAAEAAETLGVLLAPWVLKVADDAD
ncbi:MAG TPA: hypothetical protein VNA14_06220 [Mycobacteriales bacterium]|nr:hypothetical protein [Mycobacteriales bacterium]